MQTNPSKVTVIDIFWMTLGTCLIAAGVYFFKFPNHFSAGGVSGLAIILEALIPVVSAATFNSIISILFLVVGFFVLDRSFGFRTVYCSLLYLGVIQLCSFLFPMDAPLTDELLLELLFAVLLPAIGTAILFNMGASSGGTEIVALVLKKHTGIDAGQALLFSDVIVAVSALFLFGIQAGLCSILALLMKSVMIDSVIESLNRKKAFFIITSQPEPVCTYITESLNRGATLWEAQGAYTHVPHQVVLTVLSRSQAVALRNYLKETDPSAFLIVANSSEIIGKGFLRA